MTLASALTSTLVHVSSGSCDTYWDGVDFSQCFHDRFLRNAPLSIVILALAYFAAARLYRHYRPLDTTPVQSEKLVSPTSDSDLAKLEADVILGALASSILPRPIPSYKDGEGEKDADRGLSSDEAEEVIKDFKRYDNVASERWERVGWVVSILGGLLFLGISLAKAIVEKDWRSLPFPALIAFLCFSPRGKVIPLLTIHLIPSLFLFRSSLITHTTHRISIAALIIELAYFFAMISIPYQDPLDRLLGGAHCKGGGNSGSDVPLPNHYEEPISVLSRATYVFIIPFLVKHYFSAIKLEEVPAIREDDSASAGLGAFRAFRARKDALWARKHLGEKRKRNLAWDLLQFFAPEMIVQTIWSIIFIFIQYLAPNGLRLLLRYISERDTSDRPAHVAYLYVAMMAGGQVMGITAMGQCLFIGRRVCIRLRAIIIAEVFTKALRRRDVAGSTKKAQAATSPAKDGKPTPAVPEAEVEGASDGKIANHVSVDAFAISEICAYIFYIVSSPLAIVVNSFFLYQNLGVAAFAGIAILVLMIPVQGAQSRLYTTVQKKFMAATDARLDAVTEIISHVKLIKFNAWETKFFDRMAETRRHELKMLAHRFGVNVMFQVVIWGTPLLVTACAFAVHVLVLEKPLRADTAFSSLILFNMLRDPLGLFQDTLTRLIQAYTSCTRIQAFLDEPDTEKYQQLTRPGPNDPQIGFKNAMVGYSSAADIKEAEFEPFQLGPLNLSFPVGALSAIVGSVGSGKTTLIASLLGETQLLQGKIYMPDDHANRDICPIDPFTGLSDTVAYCAQSAWLVGASIKDNIVFGSSWDKKRYNAVVHACALKKDFEIFDLGDETEVGEKGTTCSGGQKARIALARALYSPARTILLDDVLSAVDAQTARHLHVHCLMGPLMKNRTVIIVTHQVNLVAPSAAYVVSLQDGQVVAAGSPSELVASGDLELSEEELDHGDSQTSTSSTLAADSDEPVDIIEENLDGIEHDALDGKKKMDADQAAPEAIRLAKQLVATEMQGSGVIKLSTYMLYFKSMGGMVFWVILAVAFGGAQLLQIASNAWIKDWANANDPAAHRHHGHGHGHHKSNTNATASSGEMSMQTYLITRSTEFYLGVYVAITAVFLVGVAARFGIGYIGSLRASAKLYDKLLKRILGAKMRFFDSTPSGRIINRLSKDMSSIDTEAGEILLYFLQTILAVAASLGVVVFSTPAFLLPLILIAVVYWFIGLLYVTTSRELKRMDSTTRSPLFISFSEALVGMSTIRSYGDSARFMRKILRELDQNTRCFWYLWQTNRVLHNFSNFTGSLVTIFACVFALRNKEMSAGAVGFSISYALSFTEYVLWIVRMYAAAEMSMNSVERVGEYLDLEVEEEEYQRGIEPPAHWPSRDSKVEVENLTCHYAPQLEPVLRGVSFEIGPKEKIGICGRTGSGKSTLALSFFRFLHQSGGSIRIDGIDISRISLSTLRSRLTILPQEAQLFSGTVRENLDPFHQHEDLEIWEALRQCGLASTGRTPNASGAPSRVASRVGLSGSIGRKDLKGVGSKVQLKGSPLRKGLHDSDDDASVSTTAIEEGEERVTIRSLDEKVAVGGKNFSQGQRQLLALARGLLKLHNSSFLIMDESTANLDHATDQTIQNVLRTGLRDTQMLVIAHRLLTVVELDKILVLDHGEVVEFGTPWELIQKDGVFRELCRQSGEDTQLMEMAKMVHERREREADA